MNNRVHVRCLLVGGFLFAAIRTGALTVKAAEPVNPIDQQSSEAMEKKIDRSENKKILVEIYLSPDQKENIDAVKKEFEVLSITKVRPQLFRKGHPPQNIGFGKGIPADVAREAIRLATTYNGEIQFFLPEKRLASHYIGIGVSIFDEAFQIPVGPDDLKRLSDPTLTTPQFHELYDKLTDQPPRINR
jgi:hypothetical protein